MLENRNESSHRGAVQRKFSNHIKHKQLFFSDFTEDLNQVWACWLDSTKISVALLCRRLPVFHNQSQSCSELSISLQSLRELQFTDGNSAQEASLRHLVWSNFRASLLIHLSANGYIIDFKFLGDTTVTPMKICIERFRHFLDKRPVRMYVPPTSITPKGNPANHYCENQSKNPRFQHINIFLWLSTPVCFPDRKIWKVNFFQYDYHVNTLVPIVHKQIDMPQYNRNERLLKSPGLLQLITTTSSSVK